MDYDLAVIGAGWAGFNAAIRARELGLRVCLIEKDQIGGTCLNKGCIPTKTLIQSVKALSLSKKSHIFGLEPVSPKINFIKICERKERIIQQLRKGLQFLLKEVDFLSQEARIVSNEEIKVGNQMLKTKYILIATGSSPVELERFEFNSKNILSSSDILNLKEIPDSILVVGGGVIGCEFASLFSGLGTKVTVVEKMSQLIPGEDKEVAKKLESLYKKKGIKVYTNTDAQTLNLNEYSLTLVCVGRKPDTRGLGLESLELNIENGKIIVDEYLRTNMDNVFAAGDCTGKIMLAHFAAYQGRIASENIANPGNLKKADNINIPNCIFTDPEIASVGLNEEKARNQGIDIEVNKFDFQGSAMARILDETDGFIKIISNKKTGKIVGSAIIGPRATELISVLILAVSCDINISQIRNTIFAHPTLSEVIPEALG
jgi:dihydrolipoamide dehydrogenase